MFLTISMLVLPFLLQAQTNRISGKVVNGETGAPLANASVFLSNTSKGTISNAEGAFELSNIPSGSYELVISCIGYRTHVYSFTSAKLPLLLQVQLQPKASDLDAVTIEPDEKDGWVRWGNFFLEHFIGTTNASRQCALKNPEVLRFRFSKKRNELTVIADEPLQIVNKSLGYRVQYQLENFSFDFNARSLLYMGYPLFSEIDAGRASRARYDERRRKVYMGSIMHFMRSLYANTLEEEGFQVRRLVQTPNFEKQRVRSIYRNQARRQLSGGRITIQGPVTAAADNDSSAYYNRILSQPDMFDTYGQHLLTADSVLVATGQSEKTMFFTDYLHVIYTRGVEEKVYVEGLFQKRKAGHPNSSVRLLDHTPVVVEENGNYMPPEVFFSSGYWAWSEKMSHLLPYEYEPAVKK